MLPKGSISKIIEYYAKNPQFDRDIELALVDFFDLREIKEMENIKWDETAEGLFNEWLVYDFRLAGGRTILEDFCRRDPYQLGGEEMLLYRDLLATQFYGFFEVKEVRLDEGLTIYDLRTGKTYEVKERLATHDLKPGNLFHNRLAYLDGHWEMVGANGPVWPIHLGEKIRQILRKGGQKNKLTPKDTYQLISRREKNEQERLDINPAEARAKLRDLLETTGLNQFVDVDAISRWCQREENSDKLNKPFEILSLIFGLADDIAPKFVNDLVSAVQNVYNTTPQKILGGKSPQEKITENPDYIPEFTSDINVLGGKKWLKKLELAHDYMHQRDYEKAARTFEKVFAALLEEKTTRAYIYRVYANKAVAHFAAGEEGLGEKMVELALALNPNYDFARKLKKKYEAGDYNKSIGLARLTALGEKKGKGEKISVGNLFHTPKKAIENDPAVKYYEYLKLLGINFATKQLTTSKLITFGRTKTGRNDPCPCGSGKKFKKCCGK